VRILVLDEEFCWPLNTGKRLRSFHLLSGLAKKHEMRYLGYGSKGSYSWAAIADANMGPIAVEPRIPPKSGLFFYLRLLWNLFSPHPYIVQSLLSKQYAEQVQRQVDDFKPNVVISESTFYAVYFKPEWSCERVIATHNIESDIWRRYLQVESNLFKRWFIRIQWQKVARFEQTAMQNADAAVAVSEADARKLSAMNSESRVKTIDNGVDLQYFHGRQFNDTSPARDLVFIGSMDWRPNQDAVMFFVNEILPLLHQQLPNVTLTIVGRHPPPDILRLGREPGVEVTGTVEDVRPYYEKAAICIVPLRIGGGSRLKILEGCAMGCPVVSTTVGAEGLKIVPNETILIADTPDDFASQIVRVFDDCDLARKLSKNGYEMVNLYYGWDGLVERLDQFLRGDSEKRYSA